MAVADWADGPLDPDVVVDLGPLVRRILAPNPSMMTGAGTNTYLVGHGAGVTCIDPGPADEPHLDAVAAALVAAGDTLTTILVTHTHSDHSPGARGLAERTGAVIRGHGPMLRPGVEHHDDTFATDHPVADGERVAGGDHTLVAVHTPGHASNHLCFTLATDDGVLLFTGDHVMSGSTVVIAPLDGDMTEYLAALRTVQALDAAAILPGHGAVVTDPAAYLQHYLDHRGLREGLVAAALAGFGPGGASTDTLVKAVYSDIDEKLIPVALYSLWAILRKLRDDGAAASSTPDVIDGHWRTSQALESSSQTYG